MSDIDCAGGRRAWATARVTLGDLAGFRAREDTAGAA
jgi:hypothetical protein